ncbi:hypothetical protein PF006_g15083 [Phytophthora fragariae]|uniref:Uncharacterized protein n=1 Tax=Phytophthora fragariae TaxID=53985 RepID=A0A6A3TBH2_9STRA|nr:hypothetical protein PF009_g13027 [Phytophthora fragariae]KAE9133218.1 hypothetical protein PF006_g15083 [Phytophthora fragariae]
MFSFLSQSPATPPKQRVRSSQTSLQKNPSSVDAARCVKGSRLSRQASSADRLSSGSRVKRALCASGAEDDAHFKRRVQAHHRAPQRTLQTAP